jgi:Brp/Blh family beta-carotene 15,15'-monooxygenase
MQTRYLLSAFILGLSLLFPDALVQLEWIVFIGLVATVGLLHGALDHKVAFEYFAVEARFKAWIRFLMGYLGVMMAYGIAWYVFPALALALFLGLSVWHFGQSDLSPYHPQRGAALLFVTRSSAVLAMILGFHLDETQAILASVIDISILNPYAQFMAIGAWGLHVLTLLIYRPHPMPKALLDITWLGIISYFLPLLMAFSVYFGLWHSVNHLHELRAYLRYDSWFPLVRDGLVFTLLAIIFLIALIVQIPDLTDPSDAVLFSFIGISLMTLPHMLLVDRMMQAR